MPLRALILAFCLGVACLQWLPELPDLRWSWLPLMIAPFSILLPDCRAGRLARIAFLVTLALSIGLFYADWRAGLRMSDRLPTAWAGQDIRLTGRIDGLPEKTPRGWRFVLDVTGVGTPGAHVPGRVRLNLYDFANRSHLRPGGGRCVTLVARLHRPHASINFGGFDYEAWLLERDIRALGYGVAGFREADSCGYSLKGMIDGWRDAVRRRLNRTLAGQPYAGVVDGLAVGDQGAISDAQWTLFRKTGVVHLVSISGLHVTLLAGLAFALIGWGWRRVAALAVRLPARKAASLAGFAVALFYVAMAGFGLPAQRTLYMLGMVAAALWLGRTESPTRILAAALGLVVVIDPWAVLAPGFWLSFGAVAVLFYAGSGRLRRPSVWREWLQAQGAITLALAPPLLMLFHGVSLVAPLANAFAIPLISWVAVPSVLAAVLLPIPALAYLAHWIIAFVMAGLNWLAAVPEPVWHVAQPGWPALLLALLGTVLLLMPRGMPRHWLGAALFLPLLFPVRRHMTSGEFDLDVLDVGQGSAVVVRTASHSLAYDAGPRYASGEDAGAQVVAPFLYANGINRLSGLVVSHADIDHSGGLASLKSSHAPPWILASYPLPGGEYCRAGQSWRWDGVSFIILHPAKRLYGEPGFSENDMSCVLKVSSPYGTALLTGDIARLGELSLMALPAPELRSDVLLVPHHGSGGSSMAGFIRAVRPDIALISVGYHNRFRQPAGATLNRYHAAGVRVVRTDREGGIRIRFVPGGRIERHAVDAERRYWRHR